MAGTKKALRKRATKNAADIEQRVSDLRRYNVACRDGKNLVDDAEYDALVEELRSVDPTNPWLEQAEPETLSGSKVKHGQWNQQEPRPAGHRRKAEREQGQEG